MHDFKERVVSVPQQAIVELHNSSTPKIVHAVFFFVLADSGYNVTEEFP